MTFAAGFGDLLREEGRGDDDKGREVRGAEAVNIPSGFELLSLSCSRNGERPDGRGDDESEGREPAGPGAAAAPGASRLAPHRVTPPACLAGFLPPVGPPAEGSPTDVNPAAVVSPWLGMEGIES